MKLTLWHGGRNLESTYNEIKPSATGRWEHGPGLYLTNHLDTAIKYAKGGGKTYKVTIDFNPEKSIGRVSIELDTAIKFVKNTAKKSTVAEIVEQLNENSERSGTPGKINIETVLNLLLNYNALTPAKTVLLAEFLIENGVQYGVTRYGGRDEVVVIVYDRSIIKKVSAVSQKDISTDEWIIEVPSYDWKGFTGGVAESTLFPTIKELLG